MAVLRHGDVQEALPGWRVLLGSVHATFATGSFEAGVELVQRIAQLAEEANHHPDVDLRYSAVHVRLRSHDVEALTERDVDLATGISAVAAEMGIEVDTSVSQVAEIALDALDIAAVRPFWAAVLGYRGSGGSAAGVVTALEDPSGIGPPLWFQQMDAPRPQRNRFHLDVAVPHDVARQRVAAALEAGGRLVTDEYAPAFWVLADPEGNEACICTWQGRATS